MFKIINKYQTGDGVTHDTEKKAREHVEVKICEEIRAAIRASKPCKAGRISAADMIQIVETLYEYRAHVRQALELEQFGDDGRDDAEELTYTRQ